MAELQAGLGQDQASVDVFTPRKASAVPVSAPPVTKEPVRREPVSEEPTSSAALSTAPASASAASSLTTSPEAASLEPANPAGDEPVPAADPPAVGTIHHVELWVPDLDRAVVSWGWLLTTLGYRMYQDWPGGRSWRSGHAYIVVEQSPARTAGRHDRCRPGLNHLAFHVGSREQADEFTREAQLHGWKLMFADRHPFAGGPQHYAAYLENRDGFEVELVAG